MRKANLSLEVQEYFNNLNFDLALPPHAPLTLQHAFKRFWNVVLIPWQKCSCCLAWHPANKLHNAPISKFRLHHLKEENENYKLCAKCYTFKPNENRQTCPYNPHNLLTIPQIPPGIREFELYGTTSNSKSSPIPFYFNTSTRTTSL